MEQLFTSSSVEGPVNKDTPLVDLGLTDYLETLQLQRKLASSLSLNNISEHIIITEHFPVYTCGRRTPMGERPVGSKIPVIAIERGGGLTYHGPGQIVGYPILNLNKRKLSIPFYLRLLEETLIMALKKEGVEEAHYKKECLAGVWIGDKKVVSIGIAVRKWVTFHGFALNVDLDLEPFKQARPCGMPGDKVTSLKELGYLVSKDSLCELVKQELLNAFF